MKLGYYFVRVMHRVFKGNCIKGSRLSKHTRLCYDIQMVNSQVGDYSYIGEHSYVIEAEIGKYCSIADGCVIGGPAHDYRLASTSPVFTAGRNIFGKNFASVEITEYQKTVIGNDVWLGSRCLVKAGVTIGDGAVIGMGSVVTKNVGAYEIWAGNPARLIKKRFEDDVCEQLIKGQWWNLPEDRIKELAPLANDVQAFAEQINQGEEKK